MRDSSTGRGRTEGKPTREADVVRGFREVWSEQKMSIAGRMIATVALVLLSSCGGTQEPANVELAAQADSLKDTAMPGDITISLVDTSDYQSDFLDAIGAGDMRFIAVMGYSTEVPGVPEYYERYSKRYGIKIVEGTSDYLDYADTVAWERNAFSRDYARGYNALLLQYLSADSE
ncbi:MAG: hypothetical protein NTW07_02570 [candidate division Zixibacteria bacterium]|nr:hypothetical protein [candidate division Zixibacteria bacterium]